jgi:hypothetical protein
MALGFFAWQSGIAIAANAFGSLVGGSARCVCVCEFSHQADEGALKILESQLARCVPCAAAVPRGQFEGFALGAIFGVVVTLFALLLLKVGYESARWRVARQALGRPAPVRADGGRRALAGAVPRSATLADQMDCGESDSDAAIH